MCDWGDGQATVRAGRAEPGLGRWKAEHGVSRTRVNPTLTRTSMDVGRSLTIESGDVTERVGKQALSSASGQGPM